MTEEVDRVPPAHGTTHADELVQGLGGLVPGICPAPFRAHWNLLMEELALIMQ